MSLKLDGSVGLSNTAATAGTEISAGMAAAGLALQANLLAGQADSDAQKPGAANDPMPRTSDRSVTRSRIKRRPARIERRPRAAALQTEAMLQVADAQRNTNSELRDWLKENASLLSNASLLISISAIALKALPAEGVLNPYIQALIFAAALTLLVEMHHQWPEDLQLHMFRRAAFPRNHSRRMTTFAVLMQLATVLFAAWATLTNPLILFPLAAFAIFIAFRQWYFQRFPGWPARIFGIVFMVLVLLITELLMVIVWATFTGNQFTIVLGDGLAT